MNACIYLSIDCLALRREKVKAMFACMHLSIYLSLDCLTLKKEEVRMAVRYRRMFEVDRRD